MSGRAGRPGYDTVGYSYLLAKSIDEGMGLQERYVYGDIEKTNSKLIENKDAVYRQIIAQVASGLSRNPDELTEFFNKTFYGHQMQNDEVMSILSADSIKYELQSSLEFLLEHGIIRATPEGLSSTEFGMLIARSNYSVKTAVRLKEFARAKDDLVPSQLVYEISRTPDLPIISLKGRKSREPVRDRLNRDGVFVVDVANPEATAAVLLDWMDERSEYEMENAYNVYAAGARRSAYEASLLVKFYRDICQVQGIYIGIDLLEVLSARLYYGAKKDILPLVVSIRGLGRRRARNLVDAFGSDLNNVSREELLRIDGVGPKTADNILKHFRND
jgi:helicase